jgi:hypothetical protein
MSESKAKTKQLLSVYIDKDLIEKVKQEAQRQHRKISGQVELYLAAATHEEGD